VHFFAFSLLRNLANFGVLWDLYFSWSSHWWLKNADELKGMRITVEDWNPCFSPVSSAQSDRDIAQRAWPKILPPYLTSNRAHVRHTSYWSTVTRAVQCCGYNWRLNTLIFDCHIWWISDSLLSTTEIRFWCLMVTKTPCTFSLESSSNRDCSLFRFRTEKCFTILIYLESAKITLLN
jgi:hypothetical protein